MNNAPRKTLSAEQKLELAKAINSFIEAKYPDAQYRVDPQVLVLALYARTEPYERAALFADGLK